MDKKAPHACFMPVLLQQASTTSVAADSARMPAEEMVRARVHRARFSLQSRESPLLFFSPRCPSHLLFVPLILDLNSELVVERKQRHISALSDF